MNLPLQPYRLTERGQAGESRAMKMVWRSAEWSSRACAKMRKAWLRCEVRSPGEVGRILPTAYGSATDVDVLRLHRGLCRAAAWIQAGDLALAGIEAVTLGSPDVALDALAKLLDPTRPADVMAATASIE